jgi:enoyl-CoA hydratase
MTSFENIVYEKKDVVGWVKLSRPKFLNALNQSVLGELAQVFDEMAADTSLAVVVITGAGKAFVAGADIAEMKNLQVDSAREFASFGQRVFSVIENFRAPVIAAVNGFALGGGCELAISCDLRLASENASFGQPEVKLGLIPGFGGTQRLSQIIGAAKAKELIYTGKMIDARTALAWGLVNDVVAPESLEDIAMKWALEIAANGRRAVAAAKKAVQWEANSRLNQSLQEEAKCFGNLFGSGEPLEGLSAFLEKRKANWK